MFLPQLVEFMDEFKFRRIVWFTQDSFLLLSDKTQIAQ